MVNKLALLLICICAAAWAKPETEYNKEGTHFRVHNPDERAYYCVITLANGDIFEKILYPGMTTRWYSMRGGYSWDCES